MTSEPTATTAAAPAIEVRGVHKTYGTVRALAGVNLTLRRGTVHGLVGENGSGKSTLTKIIAGVVTPDEGTLSFDGEQVDAVDPRTAIQHGVRVIFQDLALFPNMTVAENLTFEGDRPLLRAVRGGPARGRAREALDALGLDLPLEARLGDLSTAERQLVAIARTVSSRARIVLMDEPTASLTHQEIDRLLGTVRRLSDQGLSFVFISHKLREVVSIADDVTVIRDGAVVSSGPAGEYDQERISSLMTGGLVQDRRRQRTVEAAAPVLEVTGLTLSSSFRDIDLTLHEGQVLGLAGLVGSGRIEIGLAVVGLVRPERGEVRFRGAPLTDRRGDRRLQYVPDDRLTEGLFLDWSIADNIIVNDLSEALGRGRTLAPGKVVEVGERWRERLRIKTPDVRHPAASLSGGNQQRVLLARSLAPTPEVVVLNNPTVGVDVGSRADIHNLIRDAADAGTAILLISDEPAELLAVCDDVVFIRDGRVAEQRPAASLQEQELIDIAGQGGHP